MLEASRIVACIAAVLLFAAVAAWAKTIWDLLPQRLDGRAMLNSGQAKFASELLLWAVGVCAFAALLAVSGCVVELGT